jgi:hypothetical protein
VLEGGPLGGVLVPALVQQVHVGAYVAQRPPGQQRQVGGQLRPLPLVHDEDHHLESEEQRHLDKAQWEALF